MWRRNCRRSRDGEQVFRSLQREESWQVDVLIGKVQCGEKFDGAGGSRENCFSKVLEQERGAGPHARQKGLSSVPGGKVKSRVTSSGGWVVVMGDGEILF